MVWLDMICVVVAPIGQHYGILHVSSSAHAYARISDHDQHVFPRTSDVLLDAVCIGAISRILAIVFGCVRALATWRMIGLLFIDL